MINDAWPSNVSSSTILEIGGNFNYSSYSGWASATTPGCSAPSYTLYVSVY